MHIPNYTLLGEYCGVIKSGARVDEESAADPEGLGGLKQDKLKEFKHIRGSGALPYFDNINRWRIA